MAEALLSIEDLSVAFEGHRGRAVAVDRVSLRLDQGETLGLVGESGCGKSVTSLAVMGLLESPPARIKSGRVMFEGRDLLKFTAEQMRRVRGRKISMIFQEPMTSLNPVMSIGRQVAEPLMVHGGMAKKAAYEKAAHLLDMVRIPAPRARLKDYPHQLSGGMRQRVMIALALALNPRLLIADEPTTALDVTIQAQILNLINRLKDEIQASVLLITHDLGVVAQMAGRVAVMYAGQVVELAGRVDVFDRPFHPYTQGLIKSMPRLGLPEGQRLSEIPGLVPELTRQIPGCKFAERCGHAFELCGRERPGLEQVSPGQWARCWLSRHPEKRRAHA